jgi:hypothetical protein
MCCVHEPTRTHPRTSRTLKRLARVVTCLSTWKKLDKTEKLKRRKVTKGVGEKISNETPFVFIYSSVAVLLTKERPKTMGGDSKTPLSYDKKIKDNGATE